MAYKITSQQSLMNLAAFYCSKRETSRAKLGLYLKRKCHENKIEENDSKKWIQEVLDFCEESRLVDDKRYTEILIRDYTTRGKGTRYIEQKLKEKGIPKELQKFEQNQDEEFQRALKLVHKSMPSVQSKVERKAARSSDKRFNETYEMKQKLLQKLISAGFTLEMGRKAIDEALSNT